MSEFIAMIDMNLVTPKFGAEDELLLNKPASEVGTKARPGQQMGPLLMPIFLWWPPTELTFHNKASGMGP